MCEPDGERRLVVVMSAHPNHAKCSRLRSYGSMADRLLLRAAPA
jgi:hypothetical protein